MDQLWMLAFFFGLRGLRMVPGKPQSHKGEWISPLLPFSIPFLFLAVYQKRYHLTHRPPRVG